VHVVATALDLAELAGEAAVPGGGTQLLDGGRLLTGRVLAVRGDERPGELDQLVGADALEHLPLGVLAHAVPAPDPGPDTPAESPIGEITRDRSRQPCPVGWCRRGGRSPGAAGPRPPGSAPAPWRRSTAAARRGTARTGRTP